MLRNWEHEDQSDAELLALFARERNDQAFATLVRRYSVLVWGVCYRILGHREEAEDAFQATFLVLAQKAGQISRKELVGNWLYGVALRTAQGVRKSIARRHRHEKQASTMLSTTETDDGNRPDLLVVLDAEILQLPADYRQPLILCRLEGQTYAEAARSLGCSTAAVGRRVARAEELLRDRLTKRGVALAGVTVAALLSQAATATGMNVCLVGDTIGATLAFVHSTLAPSLAVSVAKGVVQSMASGKTAYLWGALLATLVGAAVGVAVQLGPMAQGVVPVTASASPPDPSEELRRDRYGDPLPSGALTRLGTVRWRHATGRFCMAFTPDGKGLITAGEGQPARLWERATGRMLREFGDSRDNQVYVAALSPDGRTLAERVAAGDLCLWDVDTGKLLHRWKAKPSEFKVPLVISPDGKTVASEEGNFWDGQQLCLWEVATGKKLGAVKVGDFGVAHLTYSADSTMLIWAEESEYSGRLHVWDVATGQQRLWDVAACENPRRDSEGERSNISALARSPDGRLFVAYDFRVGEGVDLARLWDVATGKEMWRLAGEKHIIPAAVFSPDGKVLATGSWEGPIRLWDAATGKELRRCASCRCSLSLAFSPDGKTLASAGWVMWGSGNQKVHFWDVGSGQEVGRTDDGPAGAVCSVTFTPDGQDIVSSSWDGSLRVWDAATGAIRRQVLLAGDEHFARNWIGSIASAVSPDGKTLVAATVHDMNMSTGSSRVHVRRWDREGGRELSRWSPEISLPPSWGFSPHGKTEIVAGRITADIANPVALVYRWDAATGEPLPQIAGVHPAFSLDGKLLATGSYKKPSKVEEAGSFTLWEAATAKALCSVPVPKGHIYGLLFSPDGRFLATASRPANAMAYNQPTTIHLWPLFHDETRKARVRVGFPRVLTAKGPPFVDDCLPLKFDAWAFSPAGWTLALSSDGGTIRLLETATGKERSRFKGHGGDVRTLAFAPDGRRLASGSCDTTVLLWDVTGRLQNGHLRGTLLSAKQLESYWADLEGKDAARAGRAIWTLAADPARSVPFLAKQLRTAAAELKTQLAGVPQLIRDLDDDAFAVRENAKTELARLGEAAEPAMSQALAKSPPLEVRRRLEDLLKDVEANRQVLSGEPLRRLRVVETLEQVGAAEARTALKALLSDAPADSALALEARAALARLERR
jgi:RNA polymerase sigma factor (sigma-70 family)